MPKVTTPTGSRQGRRHNPLEADIIATGPLKAKSTKRKSRSEEEGDNFVDSKASRKILQIGQELADEDEEENRAQNPIVNSAFDFESRFEESGDEEEDPTEEAEPWGDDEDDVDMEEEIAPSDRATFDRFNPTDDDPFGGTSLGNQLSMPEDGGPTNLTDLILRKIEEFEAAQGGGGQSAPGPVDDFEIPGKVVEVYTKIGYILKRYKSGKLPKAFKILPTVPYWEDLVQITRPEEWTANATYEATKLFVSSKPATVQAFFEMVLLPKVREEIYETKKLSTHLFDALKRGLYKPAAWFKGILFPLVASGTCTLREASIISGVLVRVSIPVLHSAAAISRLCQIAAEESSARTEGGGATNIFIKALLDKKYALPFQAVDALVFHFLRYRSEDPASVTPENVNAPVTERSAREAKLPVIWHQCFLAFAERYRDNITEDQRESLLDLLLMKGHYEIGPKIRKELLAGRGRGVPLEPEPPSLGGDDTMMVD